MVYLIDRLSTADGRGDRKACVLYGLPGGLVARNDHFDAVKCDGGGVNFLSGAERQATELPCRNALKIFVWWPASQPARVLPTLVNVTSQ